MWLPPIIQPVINTTINSARYLNTRGTDSRQQCGRDRSGDRNGGDATQLAGSVTSGEQTAARDEHGGHATARALPLRCAGQPRPTLRGVLRVQGAASGKTVSMIGVQRRTRARCGCVQSPTPTAAERAVVNRQEGRPSSAVRVLYGEWEYQLPFPCGGACQGNLSAQMQKSHAYVCVGEWREF